MPVDSSTLPSPRRPRSTLNSKLRNPQVAELHPPVYSKRQIHFAACGANQILPRIPGLPDDLFTACLTCPTQISLYYHNLQTFPLTTKGREKDYVQRSPAYMQALWDSMSHDLRERLWSELQAIMHTIAWQALPSSEYQILFGQEGRAISSMAGGFILSQRVLATYRTQPESIPFIPPTNAHSLWIHWDLILDNLFAQLPKYIDATRIDTSWEAKLKLVSFMDDQLGSILTSNQGPSSDTSAFASDAALSRLPIVCQAAQTPQFRVQACKALEACIQNLDVAGLGHAINCGVLEIATQLLELDDPALSSYLISIWASLVRHSSCIKRLAGNAKIDSNGNGNGNEASPPHRIILFISHLEDNLQNRSEDNTTCIIQNAAVVATAVAALPETLSADQLCHSLELAYLMLQDEHSLVQQWGALLTAEILGSTPRLAETCHEATEDLREQLSELLASKIVETRTTAVYALSRWIPSVPVNNASDLKEALGIATQVMDFAAGDAALLMRKELVHLFAQVLHAVGHWATLALWIYIVDDAIKRLPTEMTTSKAKELLLGLHLADESHRALVDLKKVLAALEYLHRDPDHQISSLAETQLQQLGEALRGTVPRSDWDQIMVTTLPGNGASGEWQPDLVTQVIGAGGRLVKDWSNKRIVNKEKRHNSQLFLRSKLSLQAYINVSPSTAT
jgi:regulator-associated protein of mTOR